MPRLFPLVAAAALLPATTLAQPRPPRPAAEGRPPVMAQAGVSALLEARRELDLTPRQVAQLDSIERSLFTQRRQTMERMRTVRDSVCGGRGPCRLTEAQRTTMAERFGRGTVAGPLASLRRSESAGRAMALGMLDSTQRGMVRGWRQRMGRPSAGTLGFGPGRGLGWQRAGAQGWGARRGWNREQMPPRVQGRRGGRIGGPMPFGPGPRMRGRMAPGAGFDEMDDLFDDRPYPSTPSSRARTPRRRPPPNDSLPEPAHH